MSSDLLPEAKDSETPRKLESGLSAIKNETTLLALASGAAYFFAHSFEKGYLDYFGIGPDFIQVTPSDLLLVASFVSAVIFVGWYALSLVPVKALEPLLKIAIVGLPIIPLLANSLSIYRMSGYNWPLLFNLSIALAFLIFLFVTLAGHLLHGRKLGEWVDHQVKSELRAREKFVSNALLGRIGFIPVILFLSFVMGPVLGGVAGQLYASGRQTFQSIDLDGKSYVIVSDYFDGFIVVGIVTGPDGRVVLVKKYRWISRDMLAQYESSQVRASPAGLSGPTKRRHWVPFDVFWEENFGQGTMAGRP